MLEVFDLIFARDMMLRNTGKTAIDVSQNKGSGRRTSHSARMQRYGGDVVIMQGLPQPVKRL
jgi:hypothetical protein